MGVEIESKGTASDPQSLDLTGLPPSVISELKGLVAALRDNLATIPKPPRDESYGAWERRLDAWIRSHPVRETTIDDSRESLYSGRGE
ncbi:MAG: hypothetical protein ABS79_05065 [Planctomycetes bacterium SCN 63-9]|nr:MAG: hypothetical protein ABS79_05065 [Planctomycetes bacterium SCN 63-9]